VDSDDYAPGVDDFGPEDDPVAVELPPDLVELWEDYVSASQIEGEALERKAKARDALVAFLRIHGARQALVESEPVFIVVARKPIRVLDAKAVLAANPGLIVSYGRWQTTVPYLRRVGAHRGLRDD